MLPYRHADSLVRQPPALVEQLPLLPPLTEELEVLLMEKKKGASLIGLRCSAEMGAQLPAEEAHGGRRHRRDLGARRSAARSCCFYSPQLPLDGGSEKSIQRYREGLRSPGGRGGKRLRDGLGKVFLKISNQNQVFDGLRVNNQKDCKECCRFIGSNPKK